MPRENLNRRWQSCWAWPSGGPRQLVTAINARLSSQGRDRLRLDPTAGYSWVRRGFRPRPPIPGIAAAVLTERLGYTVAVSQTVARATGPRMPMRSATSDLDAVTSVDDLIHELNQLSTTATTPRSPIAGASGADLTAVVLDQLSAAVVTARRRIGHDHVLPEQVGLISAHVAALRRLDDRHGGGALSLRYVTAELRSVADLVQYASYDGGTGQQLLTIVADLAQLLGWLSFDSSRYGAAERYLLLSLGICRALGARDRAANAIGMLSYVSASAGHGPEAVRLAEAAASECDRGRSDPARPTAGPRSHRGRSRRRPHPVPPAVGGGSRPPGTPRHPQRSVLPLLPDARASSLPRRDWHSSCSPSNYNEPQPPAR